MSITPSHGMSSSDDHLRDSTGAQPWGGQQNPPAGQQYPPAGAAYDPYAAPTSWQNAPGMGAPQGAVAPFGAMGQPAAVVAAKTPGIAILLSFVWLGAGHLYAGRTGQGIALMVVNLFLILFFMVPLIGWLLSPLAWIALLIYAAISSNNAVKEHNARWGIARL